MTILCVSIGNTDNKLTQHEWAKFVRAVGELLQCYQYVRYFFGGSETYADWQNVCWLCQVDNAQMPEIKASLQNLRELYKQDSAFIMHGQGELI